MEDEAEPEEWSSEEPEIEDDEKDATVVLEDAPQPWSVICQRAGLLVLPAGVEYYQEAVRVEGDDVVCKSCMLLCRLQGI
jgi:hypothetical protein